MKQRSNGFIVLIIALLFCASAQANLVLKIDDPTTDRTEVEVEDEGALDLADGVIGVVEYCTESGAFNATCIMAISKPAEGTASLPQLLLNIDFLSWTGKLNISATDTDFNIGPTTGIAKIIGTALGVQGVTVEMWSDSSNQEFGEGDLIYRYTDSGGNMIREEAVESGPAGSLTLEAKLESKGAEMNVGFQTFLTLQASEGTVEVPNVVGQEQSAAEDEITSAGLQVGRITTTASSVPEGDVISQNPSGGADVSPGTSVDLEVSAGEAPQEIPDTRGLAGLWYDPAFDGEGYNIVVTESSWLLYYYGWRTNGERLWLVSESSTEPVLFGKSQTLDLFIADEGVFSNPAPDLSTWGVMTIIFDSCSTGRAQLEGDDGSKRTDIVKLAGIGGLDCDP